MSEAEEALAARLRQSIQGCTLHAHGPVQAWHAVEDATARGEADARTVGRLAAEACEARIAELRRQGVSDADPRIRREQTTRRFITVLLGL